MELIKKINNNFAVARDSAGKLIIVTGRGIGFEKMPCILKDLSKVSRTYYDVDERYFTLIQQIPEDVMKLSVKIVDYASAKLNQKLNANLIFTLADHIKFTIERAEKGIVFQYGITYEMKYLHDEEMKIGEKATTLINKIFQLDLPVDEAAIIAMHILEAEHTLIKQGTNDNFEAVMKDVFQILQKNLNISIDKNSFSYCRFVTHMQYLLQRRIEKKEISSENKKLFDATIKEFPGLYQNAMEIQRYFQKTLNWSISDEELLYLMLHVNRLLNSEDCNR